MLNLSHYIILLVLIVDCLSFKHIRNTYLKLGRCTRILSTKESGEFSKATLADSSLWRLEISLEKSGFKTIPINLNVRFVEERGYEPPQGNIFVQDDVNGFTMTDQRDFSGKWTLSEDKNNRKDGLWIWGLFEEPKYPFLYFNLDVYDSIVLPSGLEEKVFGEEGIPGGKLFCRFNHFRDPKLGVVLSNGLLTYRSKEMMNADPLGLGGQVDVGEEITAGRVTISHMTNT